MGTFFNSSALAGSSSVAAQYIEPTSLLMHQSVGLIAVAAVFLVACWVTVGLRLYVRTALIHGMGVDDWAMMVTLLLFTAQATLFASCASFLIENDAAYARGETNTSKQLPTMIAASYCLYSATMVAFKFALGFFFLRIFKSRKWYAWLIIASMVIPAIVGVINIIYTAAVPCQIQTLFFVGLAFCSDVTSQGAWLGIAEAWTLLNAVSDVLYAVLSVVAIVQLKMPWRQKLVASFLCAVGCLGGIASCVRLGLFISTNPGISLLGEGLLQAIWTLIEPGLGITAASVATLRPLLKGKQGSSNGAYGPTHETTAEGPRATVVMAQLSKVDEKKEARIEPDGRVTHH